MLEALVGMPEAERTAALKEYLDSVNAPPAEAQPQPAPKEQAPASEQQPKQKHGPKINAAQVWGRAQRKRKQDEVTGARYDDQGFGKLPNGVLELIGSMSAPVAKLYMICCLLAKGKGSAGTFRASYLGLAKLMGVGNGKDRQQHAERAMRRLIAAGMVLQLSRGSAKSKDSNAYQLLSLAKLNLDHAKEILSRPLTKGGRAYANEKGTDNGTAAVPYEGSGDGTESVP
jgi:hypothetical protein